jgi:hypothetical protein
MKMAKEKKYTKENSRWTKRNLIRNNRHEKRKSGHCCFNKKRSWEDKAKADRNLKLQLRELFFYRGDAARRKRSCQYLQFLFSLRLSSSAVIKKLTWNPRNIFFAICLILIKQFVVW